jgi:hypothetical protein
LYLFCLQVLVLETRAVQTIQWRSISEGVSKWQRE